MDYIGYIGKHWPIRFHYKFNII